MDKTTLIKYLLGECDAQESLEIAILFELSPDVKKEFEDLKKEWQTSNIPEEPPQTDEIEAELGKYMHKIVELRNPEKPDIPLPKPVKIDLRFLFKVAALVIISLGLGSAITYMATSGGKKQVRSNNLVNLITVPKGGKSISVLPDGTKVWLNAGTTLKYSNNFGILNRDVELEGEAYFKVTTNPDMPFTVVTSELKIKAYGTAFNVKAYPEEKLITTTLEEGKITVQGKGINIVLKPKQNITYERREFLISEKTTGEAIKVTESKKPAPISKEPKINMLTDVNTQLYTSWKDGQWIIESETLPEVAILLERKFNVSVHIESDELLTYKFSGTFTNETLEQILNAFHFTAPIEFKINKGVVDIKLDKRRKANYMEIIEE